MEGGSYAFHLNDKADIALKVDIGQQVKFGHLTEPPFSNTGLRYHKVTFSQQLIAPGIRGRYQITKTVPFVHI